MADIHRRALLAGMAALPAAACTELAETEAAKGVFDGAENWHRATHRALAGRQALAPEYAPDERSPDIRGNGSVTVDTADYRDGQRYFHQGFLAPPSRCNDDLVYRFVSAALCLSRRGAAEQRGRCQHNTGAGKQCCSATRAA